MPELGTYGSVGDIPNNRCFYPTNFYVTNETTYDIIIATVDIRIVTCVSNSQQIMRISTDMLMVL